MHAVSTRPFFHLKSTSRSQTFYLPFFPGNGQGGKQNNESFVALEQHFYDSCHRAKVTIDLKGGMGIEQVRVQPAPLVVKFSRINQSKQVGQDL